MQDLQYWRKYVRAGLRIIKMFPMERNVLGHMACTCNRGSNCTAVGKHPKSKNWQKDRRDSESSIDLMGGRKGFPFYGVSLEGLLVVDVDPRNGGWVGLEKLEAALDMTLEDEAMFVVSTGGGGVHYYFRNTADHRLLTGMKEFPGIDFKRGVGHYVMGAGSLHSSGGTYDVITGTPEEIGDAPAALLALIKAPEWVAITGPQEEASAELVEQALFAIPNDDLPYDDWLVIGMALAHWDNEENFALFDRWSQQSTKYDENETDRKFRSFGDTGARTIGTIFGIAADCGWTRPMPPAWGELDRSTGELIQSEQVKINAREMGARFSAVSTADLLAGSRRREESRREEVIARQAAWQPRAVRADPEPVEPAEPVEPGEPENFAPAPTQSAPAEIIAEPAPVVEKVASAVEVTPDPSPATKAFGAGWAAPLARDLAAKKAPRVVSSGDDFDEPDDFQFGDTPAPLIAARKVQEAAQARPAPAAAPHSVPPPPRRKGQKKFTRLPGLAGRLVDHMERTAWAFQRPAAEAAALQALSCASWGAFGFAGAPMSLITLVVADTASGKDHPQKVFHNLMDSIGRPVFPEARSDKDFMYGLAEQDGKLCLVIDEAHSFFSAMENERAPAYMVSMSALLLKAATSDRLVLARNHLADFTEKLRSSIRDYQKQIEKVEDMKGVWAKKSQPERESEINKLEALMVRAEERIDDLKSGIKGIHFNLLASSTPVKFNKFINAETVGSGLIGRAMVFDCGYGAPPQRKDVPPAEEQEFNEIAILLRDISDQAIAGVEVQAQAQAIEAFDAIYEKFIADDEFYNHAELGGLYRRIRERVYSLSSILAAGNHWIITEEIVDCALRLCEGHLSSARSMIKQNDWESSDKDAKAAVTEIVLRILKRSDTANPMNRSTFRQRLEKHSTTKKINKDKTNPKFKGADFLSQRVQELKSLGVIATNGDADSFTRIWLTSKGVELAQK